MILQKILLLHSLALRKKVNKFFVLKTNCSFKCGDYKIYSNYVTVISPVNKYYGDNFTCETPHWRN